MSARARQQGNRPRGFFENVAAVFADLDGTLTTGGRVLASTYGAMEALNAAGVGVVVVTGRPSGWAEAIARTWPVAAAVAENGGVLYWTERGKFKKAYGVSPASLPALRRKMFAHAKWLGKKVPGARLAADTPATEVNLAIDWNEQARLPMASAKRIEELLRDKGYNAVRSSVHVNFWPGRFDKLSACKTIVQRALAGDKNELDRYVFVGDALNDEPMFGGFARSVGVANVADVWDDLTHKPAWVTSKPEGHGFEQLAKKILAAR